MTPFDCETKNVTTNNIAPSPLLHTAPVRFSEEWSWSKLHLRDEDIQAINISKTRAHYQPFHQNKLHSLLAGGCQWSV